MDNYFETLLLLYSFFLDCTQSTAVMSTNIVSFLLLSSFRDGGSIDEIALALDSMRTELEWSGRDCGFSGDSVDVINYAVSYCIF